MRSAVDYGFPPFTRAVKALIFINAGIFLVAFFAGVARVPLGQMLDTTFGLQPTAVLRGQVWQIVTYSFLHAGVLHILFNMLSLWMFGSRLEQDWGRRRFLEFYFFCVVGAAVTTVAIAYTRVLGMSPTAITVGASGGIYGLIVAFGVLYGNMRVYIYGIFAIPAKVFAAVWVGLALLGALGQGGDVNNIAHLGGAVFGYLYLKLMPRKGLQYATSETYYGVRNRYERWKRRRMARKFEVYMRDHDRKRYFDEYGNYRAPQPPEASEKKDDGEGKSGWVN